MISKNLGFLCTILGLTLLLVVGPLPGQDDDSVDSPFATGEEQEEENPFRTDPATDEESESPFDAPEGEEEESPFEVPEQEEEESPFESITDESSPSLPVDDPFASPGTNEPVDPFAAEPVGEDPFAVEDPFAPDTVPGAITDPFANSSAPSGASRARGNAANIRGVYVLATQPGMQNFAQLQQLAEDFTSAEFSRLYGEARTVFGTAYASEFEKALPYVTPGFTNPLNEIRDSLPGGSEIVAVVDLLPTYSAATGRTPPETNPLGRNPSLICESVDGDLIAVGNEMYLDPGNPQARTYLQNLVLEIERVIEPDAILFRGVQYPGPEWGYSEGAVEAFRNQVGGSGDPQPNDPTWSAWRRHQLTNLLSDVRLVLRQAAPNIQIGVYITTDGTPPATWQEYTNSKAYTENMQDWIRWCRDGLIDEIVFEVHERVGSQELYLESWVNFANDNSYGAKPVISLAGYLNFSSGIAMQYNLVRSRGVGTLLHHYDDPLRSHSRGFFSSLPNVVFRNSPGRPIPGVPITGEMEQRTFAQMSSPPSSVQRVEPTATTFVNPLEQQDLVFATPTPVPTASPPPVFVPDEVVRKVTLISGQKVDAVVLEISPTTITLQQPNGAPIQFARSVVESIEPPL